MSQDNTTSLPPVMTLSELSRICRLHHTTLRKAIREGRLQASRPTGRDLRITATAVEQWFATTSTAILRATSSRANTARKSSSCHAVMCAGAENRSAPSKPAKKSPPSASPPAHATTLPEAVRINLSVGYDSPGACPSTEDAIGAVYTG